MRIDRRRRLRPAAAKASAGALALALATALIAGCGGGGGGASVSSPVVTAPSGTLHDTTAYSTAPGASLASASESAAVTQHSIVVSTSTIAYTATIGHLVANAPSTGVPEAAFFYTAYTAPAASGATRPLVFFYNGGPGSASVWLHLGSFAPRRIVADAPALSIPLPYQLVDNAESLIDVADLVFVDAVGTGYSEAIAPATNQSYWGVDADAASMRDFIARYLAANARTGSPVYLFGESYGTTRSAVLANLMLAAGMRLDGVVLQSSILDYNANCDVFAPGDVSCAGSLPSYGSIGAWYALTSPVPSDLDAYAAQLRAYTSATYAPAVATWLQTRQTPAPSLVAELVARTGAAASLWNANLDLDATTFRSDLVSGELIGRYDARIAAPTASALAADGDPSSTLYVAPFTSAAQHLFASELGYSADAGYVLLSDAIDTWDFSHDGRGLPDTIPDLAAAFARAPALRVLSIAGYHDLATPFHQTELDVARLAAGTVYLRTFPGGHMTYLDDASRVRIKAAVVAFIAGQTPAPDPTVAAARSASATATRAPAVSAANESARIPPLAATSPRRGRLAQGGDPALPASARAKPASASPSGQALADLVARKLAEPAPGAQR